MKPKRILIVEDEVLIAAQIKLYITRHGYECAGIAVNYVKAMQFLKAGHIDLVLLDINISGEKSGIDLAHEINECFQIPFIYLTSYTDEATINDLMKTAPRAYLHKPVSQISLGTTLDITFNQLKPSDKELFTVTIGKTHHQFVLDHIDYILADHVYVELYIGTQKKTLRSSLSNILSKLPEDQFVRINRSTAVNTKKINEFNGKKLSVGDQIFSISPSYLGQLKDKLKVSEQKTDDS